MSTVIDPDLPSNVAQAQSTMSPLKGLSTRTSVARACRRYLHLRPTAPGGTRERIPIGTAEGIPTALHRELGDALDVMYADPRVQLNWQDDLRVRVLGAWGSHAQRHSLTILPGDLVSGQVLDLLIEVYFPARPPAGVCWLQVQVCDGGRSLATGACRWTWVDSDQNAAQPRSAGVERRVATFLAHQARWLAAVDNRDGDLAGARARLRQTATALSTYSDQNAEVLALAAQLDAEAEHHRARLGRRDIKERIYAAASVMKGRGLDGGRTRRDDPPVGLKRHPSAKD